MTPQQIRVAWGMLAILLLVFATDGWLWWYCGEEATFSAVARRMGENWPAFQIAVALGAGLLCGHWFL